MKKYLFITFVIICMLMLASCNREDSNETEETENIEITESTERVAGSMRLDEMVAQNIVIATVNGVDITAGQITQMLPSAEIFEASYWEITNEQWREMLESSVTYAAIHVVIAEYAAQNNITLSEDDIEEFNFDFQMMMAQYETEEEFLSDIQSYGYFDVDHLTEVSQVYMLSNKVVEVILESSALFAEFEARMGDEYLGAKHILIPYDDFDGIDDALIFAQEIRERAVAGEDFDALVAEYGKDPGMVQNPEGYTFWENQMVPEFEQGTRDIAIGEISQPIATSYGFHIILRIEPNIPEEEEILAAKRIHIDLEQFETEAEALAYAQLIWSRAVTGETFEDLVWEVAMVMEDMDDYIEMFGEEMIMEYYTGGITFVVGWGLGTEFEQTTRELAIGEMSQPVFTTDGINIILRIEPNMENVMRPYGIASPEERLENRKRNAIVDEFTIRVDNAVIEFLPELYEIILV